MDGNQVLASALMKMAASPVKADRDERECQTDIIKITTALEELQTVSRAILAFGGVNYSCTLCDGKGSI